MKKKTRWFSALSRRSPHSEMKLLFILQFNYWFTHSRIPRSSYGALIVRDVASEEHRRASVINRRCARAEIAVYSIGLMRAAMDRPLIRKWSVWHDNGSIISIFLLGRKCGGSWLTANVSQLTKPEAVYRPRYPLLATTCTGAQFSPSRIDAEAKVVWVSTTRY